MDDSNSNAEPADLPGVLAAIAAFTGKEPARPPARRGAGRRHPNQPAQLELENDTTESFGAKLMIVEIGGSYHVRAGAQCQSSPGSGEIRAAAEFVAESFLLAERRLRGQVRISDEGVRPEFDALGRRPSDSRTSAAKEKPGALVAGRVMGGHHLAVEAEPGIEVIHQREVEAVLISADALGAAEVVKRVAGINLPTVIDEDALNVLRIGRRIRWRRGRERIRGEHWRRGRRG